MLMGCKRDLLLYYDYCNPLWSLAEKEVTQGFASITSNGFKTLWEGDKKPSMQKIATILKE
jgi:hypothetical protein